jgi:predicted nucleotidyltransferase
MARRIVYKGPDKFLRALTKTLREYFGEKLVAVVLFGSYARREATETSDADLYVIAEKLPKRRLDRIEYVHRPVSGKFDRPVSIIAESQQEFVSGFPSLYLDLALDGVVLYDTGNFMTEKLARIQEVTRQAGLTRVRDNGDLRWRWKHQPAPGRWALDWEGFHEFA